MSDKPLFDSLEQALFWAWYLSAISASSSKNAAIVRLQGTDERERIDGFGPKRSIRFDLDATPQGLDGAGQAGMIKRAVDELPLVEHLHIRARYLIGDDRKAAREAIVPHIIGLMPEYSFDGGLWVELIAKLYGKPGVRIKALAEEFRVNRRKLSSVRYALDLTMRAIAARAEQRLIERLQQGGVLS